MVQLVRNALPLVGWKILQHLHEKGNCQEESSKRTHRQTFTLTNNWYLHAYSSNGGRGHRPYTVRTHHKFININKTPFYILREMYKSIIDLVLRMQVIEEGQRIKSGTEFFIKLFKNCHDIFYFIDHKLIYFIFFKKCAY